MKMSIDSLEFDFLNISDKVENFVVKEPPNCVVFANQIQDG